MEPALNFLKEHYEIAFATCEGDKPVIRIFQIMKMEGTTLYFATSDYYDLKPTPPVNKNFDLVNNTEANGYVGERYGYSK